MRGYKIFGPDYTCKGYKYSLNTANIHDGHIKPHESGFHFCRCAKDCAEYYDINDTNTYAIVESGDDYIPTQDSVVCDRLSIVKTLTKDEFLHHTNNGEYKVWYPNGQLAMETNYVDGKMNGSYKVWYDNGQLMIESTYVDGKTHGIYKEWLVNGQLWIDATYLDGIPNVVVIKSDD